MAAFKYVVQPGDNLSKLAKRFDLPSWSYLYNHSSNADFRRKRSNPNLILVGDIVMIPDPPGGYNYSLPQPPVVRQANTYWCWAASMESWLQVTPGRDPTNQAKLREMFAPWTDTINGGLTTPGWGQLARLFRMQGESYNNPPMELQLRKIYTVLKEKGFIIIVYNLFSGGPSHVNVIYGVQGEMLKVMDPQQSGSGLELRHIGYYTNREFVGMLWVD